MKKITLALLLFAFTHVPASAGPGPHSGSGDFRGVIHALFDAHEQVERSVDLIDEGYRATTTSTNPKVAEMLQTHVAQMEARLEGGMGVRHWDPAFAELREHYDDLEIAIETLENGIAVAVKGITPEAIKVAQNHARIISGFVEAGPARMHETHPAALEAANPVVEESGKPSCCPDGQKGCCPGNGGSCETAAEASVGEQTRQAVEQGEAAAQALMTTLGGQLKAALEAGGPVQALEVCQSVAQPLTAAAQGSQEAGVKLRRTTLKPRNPENAPDPVDRGVLEALAASMEAGSAPGPLVLWQAGGARYYQPLLVQEVCLKCHGDPAGFSPGLAEALAKHYPEDQATGYELGALRGVIRVDIPRATAKP